MPGIVIWKQKNLSEDVRMVTGVRWHFCIIPIQTSCSGFVQI